MPSERNIRTLSQVLGYIEGLISEHLGSKRFWLKVEISKINIHSRSGHCYLELVETENNVTVAECSGTIWSSSLEQIRRDLGADWTNVLKQGSEVLCFVEMTFKKRYGLKVNILSVDKSFTLGELERKKQETLDELQRKGLLDRQKEHRLPLVVQSIALIGSPGTSGHMDFKKQLERNDYGYLYFVEEFRCSVQGDNAVTEIVSQLARIQTERYDLVAIVRGGGSRMDLEVFNSYDLAEKIALYRLPILTGIGHETDLCVSDIVSFQHFKTPTALGSAIVERTRKFDVQIQTNYSRIMELYNSKMMKCNHDVINYMEVLQNKAISYTRLKRGELHTQAGRIVRDTKQELSNQEDFLKAAKLILGSVPSDIIRLKMKEHKEWVTLAEQNITSLFKEHRTNTEHSFNMLDTLVNHYLRQEKNHITSITERVSVFDPDNMLKMGYAIVRQNGNVLKVGEEIRIGSKLEIELLDRTLVVTVASEKNKRKWQKLVTKLLQRN